MITETCEGIFDIVYVTYYQHAKPNEATDYSNTYSGNGYPML